MRFIWIASIFTACIATAQAQDIEPFGFKGGANVTDYGGYTSLYAQYITPPDPHPLFKDYVVHATPATGICLVRGQSRGFLASDSEDQLRNGEEVRALFAEVRSQLQSKYGSGEFSESFSLFAYDDQWLNQIVKGEKHYQARWIPPQSLSPNSATEILLYVSTSTSGMVEMVDVKLQYLFSNYDDCKAQYDREKKAVQDSDAAKL
jgi:hypothetical protein